MWKVCFGKFFFLNFHETIAFTAKEQFGNCYSDHACAGDSRDGVSKKQCCCGNPVRAFGNCNKCPVKGTGICNFFFTKGVEPSQTYTRELSSECYFFEGAIFDKKLHHRYSTGL